MPPRKYSRYSYSDGILDDDGALVLSDPEPFAFVQREDNIAHVAEVGDTLWALAGRYFVPLPRPAGLWWIIADFQPTPIVDPTVALTPGATIWVPSVRTVLEEIFNDARRAAG